MDIANSGTMIRKLKRAIESTKYLAIHTSNAIYSKPDNRMIETREDSLQLYDRVVFIGAEMPDGTRQPARITTESHSDCTPGKMRVNISTVFPDRCASRRLTG